MDSLMRWMVCGVVLVGCGGSLSSPIGDGGPGSDSSPGSDGSPGTDGGSGPLCPVRAPDTNTSCPLDGLQCEYGTSPDPACNQLFQCGSGTGWLEADQGVCTVGSCPSTYASVPVNQDCSANHLACAYPEGECICTQDFGGPFRQTPGWDCFPAQTSCPAPRPDIGTPCTQSSDLMCNYGACSGGLALSCKDGRWQQVAWLCPG